MCSPFLLGGVINQHLETWESQYPKLIKEIRDDLYVDDLMTGGENAEITAEKKSHHHRKEIHHHKSVQGCLAHCSQMALKCARPSSNQ